MLKLALALVLALVLALAFSCCETQIILELLILKPLTVLKGLNYSAVLEAEARLRAGHTSAEEDQDPIQYSRAAVWSMQQSPAHSAVGTITIHISSQQQPTSSNN